jgi:predicted dienelactone hydrolase
LTDLLADPANTLSVTVTAPDDATLYGSFAGRRVAYVLLACYPTVANNPRPGYPLPTGIVVPHMQTGTDAPLFTDATARYPLLAFSHGYRGSPLSGDYMTAMSVFASYGYLVVAPFHGDTRFTDLNVDDLGDAVAVLSHLRDFVALQALRPLSMSAAIDLMLAHPQWKDHVNLAQIGGFGASMGGETVMLMGGAGLTTSVGMAWTKMPADQRLKAAVGYVPYFGEPLLPAFGRDQHGLDGITLPYLAISGTADTTAPMLMTEQGLGRLGGTRELVALAGVKHGFDVASSNDIFTWALTFFDAEVRGTPAARQQLSTMASVAGGGDDRVVIPYNGPVPR